MTNRYLDALAEMFYPQRCVGCGRRASDLLCGSCFEELPRIEPPVCRRCGAPTAFETYGCDICSALDLQFESARAPLRYAGAGKGIVHALKYQGYFTVVERLMVPLMLEALGRDRSFDLVVPVPLHRARLIKRGFNQAEVMARGISEKIKAPVSDTIKAVRRTEDQVALSGDARRRNLAGAFRIKERVAGRILLVDDVLTTGATLGEGARALYAAGAREVHALTVCRVC